MSRKIRLNVCGLWRTEIELDENATWIDMINLVSKKTGITEYNQEIIELHNIDYSENRCEFEDGDEITCFYIWNHPLFIEDEDGEGYECYSIDEMIYILHSWLISGTDINMIDKYGNTIIMHMAINIVHTFNDIERDKYVKYIEELLRLGADITIKNQNNQTIKEYLCTKAVGTENSDIANYIDEDIKYVIGLLNIHLDK